MWDSELLLNSESSPFREAGEGKSPVDVLDDELEL